MTAREPLTSCLPRVFVERGGPPLRSLLAAVDQEWLKQWSERNAGSLAETACGLGFRRLIEDAGGPERLTHPHLLVALLGQDEHSSPAAITLCLDCLFGVRLLSLRVVDNQAFVILQATCGARERAELNHVDRQEAIYHALRRLLPAHFTLPRENLTWE